MDYAVRMETQAESLTKMVDTAGVMMLKDVTANYDVMTDDNNCLDEKDRSPPVVYDQKPSVKKTFVKIHKHREYRSLSLSILAY